MPDRDDAVDRLLRQAMRTSHDAGATESCLDAETMAAWMEGALSGAALAAAEAHAATCPRCQAIVAAMVRIEPADVRPAAVVPIGPAAPRRLMSWLIPLAAAAAIVVSTIVVMRQRNEPVATLTLNKEATTTTPAAPAAPPAGLADQRTAPPTVANEAARAATGSTRRDRAERKQEATKAAAAPLPTPNKPNEPAGAASGAFRSTVQPAPTQPPPPAAAPVTAPAPIPAPAATATATPPPPPSPLTARSSTVAGLPQSSINFAADALSPVVVIAEFASPNPPLGSVSAVAGAAGAAAGGSAAGGRGGGGGGGGRGGGRGGGGGGGAAVMNVAQAPTPPTPPMRWRVLASGAVERSVTGGTAWEPVTIEPPTIRITAGAAPSLTVCWLVGRAGVVMRSVDGQPFARVTFPETVDLVSVRALSSQNATVTASDGRVFVTADGGVTWRRQDDAGREMTPGVVSREALR